MRLILLFFTFLIALPEMYAQADSVPVSENRPDGIYLTYDDFRRGRAIGREQIISDINKDQLEFMGKVVSQEKFSYNNTGGVQSAETQTVWGFFQNKTLYVNFRGEFFRVPVFGPICYLVATVTMVNGGFYDPMFGYGVNSTRTKEIREFIINYYDGLVTEFSMEGAEELLARDAALFAEFKKLSRRQRKEQVNRYIRRYNEQHPVYFLR
jgi:hypothetical protein